MQNVLFMFGEDFHQIGMVMYTNPLTHKRTEGAWEEQGTLGEGSEEPQEVSHCAAGTDCIGIAIT
jgi:hypothetical protein